MIKKFLWILAIIAVAIGILAYQDPDIKKWVMKSVGQEQDSSKLFKWKDTDGNWQISNTPPANGIPYTEQEYLHNTNIVPPLPDGKE